MSTEERFQKKREREDKYLRYFREQDKPILVIKEKKAFGEKQNGLIYNDIENN